MNLSHLFWRLMAFLLLFGGMVPVCFGQGAPGSAEARKLLEKTAIEFYGARDYDSAIFYMESALEMAAQQDDSAALRQCYNNLGLMYSRADDFPRARKYLLTALQIGTAIHYDSAGQAGTYLNLGLIYERKGLLNQSVQQYQQGLQLIEEDEDWSRAIQLNSNLGSTYLDLGDYELAAHHLEKALLAAEKITDESQRSQYMGTVLVNLGKVQNRTGNYALGAQSAQQAEAIYTRLLGPEHAYVIAARNNRAIAWMEMGRSKEALSVLDSSLKLLDPTHPYYGILLDGCGSIHVREGQFELAQPYYLRALHLKLQAPDAYKESVALACHNLAKNYLELGHPDSSLYLTRLGLAALLPPATGDPLPFLPADSLAPFPLVLELIELMGHVYADRYDLREQSTDLDSAQACFVLAVDLLERIQLQYDEEGSRLVSANAQIGLFEGLLAVFEAKQIRDPKGSWAEAAFLISEKGRASILYQLSLEAAHHRSFDLPDVLYFRHQHLSLRIHQQTQNLWEARTAAAPFKEIQADLLQLESEKKALMDTLKRDYPGYARLQEKLPVPDLDSLRRALPTRDATMIAYYVGASYCFAWKIDRKEIKMVRLAVSADSLTRLVADFLQEVSTDAFLEDGSFARSYEAIHRQGRRLYTLLLSPLVDDQPPSDLLILPHGVLNTLPFELLLTSAPKNTAKPDFRSLPYLFTSSTVHYGYSTQLLPHPYSGSPAFPLCAFAPQYENGPQSPGLLTYNLAEAEQAVGQLGGQSFVGDAATRSAFQSSASQARTLHFSGHTSLNHAFPSFSSLLFSGEEAALHAYDLYHMDIPADLVVLSSCGSNDGQLHLGEGVMSMARAFRYAGTQNVLATFWRVDDAAAGELIQGFYAALAAGEGKADALRTARMEYLTNCKSDRAHPYYWGHYVLIGDNLPVTSSPFPWWILIGGLVVVAMGIAVWFYRRTKRS